MHPGQVYDLRQRQGQAIDLRTANDADFRRIACGRQCIGEGLFTGGLGAHYAPEVGEAWGAVYTVVATVMKGAAASAAG